MRKARSVTIGGKRHRVIWRSLYGEGAMGFAHDHCLIEIDPDYDELSICDTLVHEFLHRHPATRHLEEDAVNEMGTEIAIMLHKMQLIVTEEQIDAEA